MEKVGSLGQGGSGVADVEQPTVIRDLCRDFERFQRGDEGFGVVWGQIEGFVSKEVISGLRKRLVRGHKMADDLAAHDDIVQEVCRKLQELRGKPQQWFDPTRRGRSPNGREPLSLQGLAERAEVMTILNEFLALLPPQHRQAIDLRFFEGLTDRAAGEKIGSAPSTITKRAKAAITQLRKLLSDRGVEAA